MTRTERNILTNLGVKSLGFYTSKAGTVISVHWEQKKKKWEEKAIEKYLADIYPKATIM